MAKSRADQPAAPSAPGRLTLIAESVADLRERAACVGKRLDAVGEQFRQHAQGIERIASALARMR